MDREIAQDLLAACEEASSALAKAEAVVGRMPPGEERSQHLHVLAGLFADLLGKFRVSAVRQYPELVPPEPLGEPDTILDAEDEERVSRLTTAELQIIDQTLHQHCSPQWRKVARVVGSAMTPLLKVFPDLPDGFYARRVIQLVQSGSLESQGNLEHMRFSEVRLPGSQSAV
jgi:hypothetical protein